MSEKTPIRKSMLPNGPWSAEADELCWDHRGLPCVVIRGPWWSFNGYVGVSVGHPLFGVGWQEESPKLLEYVERVKQLPMGSPKIGLGLMISALGGGIEPSPGNVLQVHGGVTYAGTTCPDDPLKRTGLWWFGWDSGHYMDYSPGMDYQLNKCGGHTSTPDKHTVYRDLAYAKSETEDLARQLAELEQLLN